MNIDWSQAPAGATHWDNKFGLWCSPNAYYKDFLEIWEGCVHAEWGTDRYIERPSLNDWGDRYPRIDDDVNHPKHYQLGGGLEAIDVIKSVLTPEQYQGYLLGNMLKYRLMAGAKGDAQKDLDKSEWYKKELDR